MDLFKVILPPMNINRKVSYSFNLRNERSIVQNQVQAAFAEQSIPRAIGECINASIAFAIYAIAKFIDFRRGELNKFDYESIPVCGHHYEGHDGRLTASQYREGDGGGTIRGCLLGEFIVGFDDHEVEAFFIRRVHRTYIAQLCSVRKEGPIDDVARTREYSEALEAVRQMNHDLDRSRFYATVKTVKNSMFCAHR